MMGYYGRTEASPLQPTVAELKRQTLAQLKALCKERGLQRYSGLNKKLTIELLTKDDIAKTNGADDVERKREPKSQRDTLTHDRQEVIKIDSDEDHSVPNSALASPVKIVANSESVGEK